MSTKQEWKKQQQKRQPRKKTAVEPPRVEAPPPRVSATVPMVRATPLRVEDVEEEEDLSDLVYRHRQQE